MEMRKTKDFACGFMRIAKARPSLSPLGDTSGIDKGLKPALIKAFGQFFDKQYADLRLQLHQVGTTLPVRRATLVVSAELVVEMTKTTCFHVHITKISAISTKHIRHR